MPVSSISKRAVQVWNRAYGRPGIIANLDETITVYVGKNQGGISSSSDRIPPLGSLGVDGMDDLYASTLDPSLSALVQSVTGGTSFAPSPAQIADQIQLIGIPPSVANLQSFSAILVDEVDNEQIATFDADGRIWAAHLSLAAYKNSDATGGTQGYAYIFLGSDPVLLACEVALSGANSTDSDDADLAFPGFAVQAGDSLYLNVNGGTGIENGGIRASTVVVCSFP